jgi:hypothetical protein
MTTMQRKSSNAGRSGSRPTLRSLYEAARREVMADPAAALRKYQPTWVLSGPSASDAPAACRARKRAR